MNEQNKKKIFGNDNHCGIDDDETWKTGTIFFSFLLLLNVTIKWNSFIQSFWWKLRLVILLVFFLAGPIVYLFVCVWLESISIRSIWFWFFRLIEKMSYPHRYTWTRKKKRKVWQISIFSIYFFPDKYITCG